MRVHGSSRSIAAMAVAALLYCAPVASKELRLIGAATSFYCYRTAETIDHVSGLACDLMGEMARRVGHSSGIELYPLARALAVTAESTGVLVAPVGRIAAREKYFAWQVLIFEDDVVVVTRADSHVDVSSIAALRKLSIGVVRDGAAALLCEQFDVRNTSAVANDDTNARKLANGRIDAWISTWNGIRASQRGIGSSESELRRGVVVSRVQAYMASSRDVSTDQIVNWKKAMSDMVNDGTYDKILKKYHFQPPK